MHARRRNTSDRVEVQTSKLPGHRAPRLPSGSSVGKAQFASCSRHDTYLRGRPRIDPCLSQVGYAAIECTSIASGLRPSLPWPITVEARITSEVAVTGTSVQIKVR